MSALADMWKSIRTIATVLDKTETNTLDIKALSTSLADARERLAALEALMQVAVRRRPLLPQEH